MRVVRVRRAAALLVLAALLPLASCRRPVSEEKRLSRELASDDDASATAALAEYARLDPPRRLEVVRLLASETTKYPFGLANAPTALRRLLPGVVPMLVELRGAPAMTSSADMALELLGPDAVGAVPSIERSIAGDDPKLRARAAAALATIAPERIAAVIAAHAEADPQVAIAAGLQLRYVARASLAVPSIAALLASDRPRVREFAAGALAEIGPRGTGETVAMLETLARDDVDPRVRRAASRALRAIAPGSPGAREAG